MPAGLANGIADETSRGRWNILFRTSMSFAIGENVELLSLSVLSSVQCAWVLSGIGEPVRPTLHSHRPACGRHFDRAGIKPANRPARQVDRQMENQKAGMLRTPGELGRLECDGG